MTSSRTAVIAALMSVATTIAMTVATTSSAAAAPPDPEPAVKDAVAPVDWSAALLARVDRVAQEVGRLRGLPRRRAIKREVVTADALRAKLAASAGGAASARALAAESMALKRWGVLPAGADYGGLLVDVLTEQIAGYYDHDARTLYIAAHDPAADVPGTDAGDAADWGDMLLAHEIDHALGDQSFDLAKLTRLPDGEGDAETARRALIEGDGMAVMIEYLLAEKHRAAPWTDPEVSQMIEHSMEANGPAGARLGAAPLWIREGLIFPYRAGLAFVASIRRRHPWASVDAAYRRPPRSTEQILHPEAYAADERPIAITAATPPSLSGFRTVWTETWGEEKWTTFLRVHGVADPIAIAAGAGWGGDRLALYARDGDDAPGHAIGVARLVWDTEVDAQEATEALVRAVDHVAGAAAQRNDDGGEWIGWGRVSWVERRGRDVVVVIGAPAPKADALRAEVWTAWKVAKAR